MKFLKKLTMVATASLMLTSTAVAEQIPTGSKEQPYRVMLIPADGGTEKGTIADFQPLFNAITKSTGIHFDVKTGQSYAAVIEGMCNKQAEIAWFGAVSYIEARNKGCAELLAVDVKKGSSVYYSGIFKKANSPIKSLADLKGKSIAVGSTHSTSSFVYPIAMVIAAGIDPAKDLSAIRITGSHSNSLKALQAGNVDVAAASFNSLGKAVTNGSIKSGELEVLAKSEPIPNPPLAFHPALDAAIKKKIREALANVHKAEGIKPEMIRGYGGKQVDSYDVTITDKVIDEAMTKMSKVNDEVKQAIIKKAGKQ